MSTPDPLLGSTIAGIRLDEKLGTGGMGSVYLGLQTSLNRRVAMKVLSEHLSSNAEYISRFRREAITAGKLEHPHIVSVYDIGHEGGRYFIVMEYIEGQSLQRILDVVGAVAPREAARLTVGVLQGLHHAHAAGVVHRDVKPGNVIVTKDNEAKLLDFGLAIGIDPRDKLTGTGSVLGTPLYISPEQAKGRAAEPRSDLYSAGVMFYALLTGRVPFSGYDPLAVLNMHVQEPPVSPINVNPRIPQALNDIVLKMLAKRPEDRHATAEAAARDIQNFLDGKLVALPARPAPRVVKRRSVPVGIIAGVVLGVGFLVGLVKLSSSPPVEPGPPPVVHRPPPPPDPELDEVRAKATAILATAARDGEKDYAVYPFSLAELGKLAGLHANRRDSEAVIEGARKALVAEAEKIARTHEGQLRPRLQAAHRDGDVYLARELLREFPRPFLEMTEIGRTVTAEIRDTEDKVARRITADFGAIPRLVEADEFDGARARVLRLGDVVPPEMRRRVTELQEEVAKAEAERRLQLLPRLLAQVGQVEGLAASLLERRQSDEAWNGILGFVESHPATQLAASLVRMTAVPLASLRVFVPSAVTEEELDSLLARFESEDPAKDEDLPSHRLRGLAEDVLRWEWVRRRAERGIPRLAGVEVTLHSFAVPKGKIVAGPPPTFEGQPLVVGRLEARDLVFLAAAAAAGPDQPVETIFKSADHRRFALAAAAAHRYAPAPDRFAVALQWTEQAKVLGLHVSAFRIAALEELARQERDQIARDLLGKALDHAAGGRYEKAHEELDRGVKEHEGRGYFPTLESVARDLRAKFLLAEGEAEQKALRWDRALAAARKLRSFHPGYHAERALPLYHKALLNAGAWATWPMSAVNAQSKTWNWDGKSTGSRPPARLEGGQVLLTDMGGFRPLFLERPKTAGATGIRARLRVNQVQQSFEMGILFDAKDPSSDMRRFLVRSSQKGEVGTRREGRWAPDDDDELKPPVAVKEWVEIAIVSDGAETVYYYGAPGALQGILTLPGAIDPKLGFALWANADTTFTDIMIRDARP